MSRPISLFVLICGGAVLLTANLLSPVLADDAPAKDGAADAKKPRDAEFRPVAPREALMEWQEKAFDGIRTAIDKSKGSSAAEHAYLLAELANVNRQHSDKEDYRSWATQVRELSLQLAKAAKAGEFDQARELSKRIDQNCTACHNVYDKQKQAADAAPSR